MSTPYKRPFASVLPLELYDLILSFVASSHAAVDPEITAAMLISLSQASHMLRALALPHMFSSLKLVAYDEYEFDELKPFNRFCQACISGDTRALALSRHVKSCHLHFSYETTPGDREWLKFKVLLADYLKALSLFKNLTQLTLADTPITPELLEDVLQNTKVASLTLQGSFALVSPSGSGHSLFVDNSCLEDLAKVITKKPLRVLSIHPEQSMWILPSRILTCHTPLTSLCLSLCRDVELLRSFLIQTPSLTKVSVCRVSSSSLREDGLDLPDKALPNLSHLECPSQWALQLVSRPIRHLDIRPGLQQGLEILSADADAVVSAFRECKTIRSLSLHAAHAIHPWATHLPFLQILSVCVSNAKVLYDGSSAEIVDYFIRMIQEIGVGPKAPVELNDVHTFRIDYPDFKTRPSAAFFLDLQAQRTVVDAIAERCPSVTSVQLSSPIFWTRAVREDSWKVWILGKERKQLRESVPRLIKYSGWRVRDYQGCLRGLFGEGVEVPQQLLEPKLAE